MLVAIGIAVVGLAAPASAGAGIPACGSSCDYQDPHTYLVWDGGQVRLIPCDESAVNVNSPVMGLQLRYSRKCETTWAMQYGCSCQLLGVLQQSFLPDGSTERAYSWDLAPSNSAATVMMDDHHYLNRVCLYYTNADSSANFWACTAMY